MGSVDRWDGLGALVCPSDHKPSVGLTPALHDITYTPRRRQPTPVKRLDLAFETVKQSALEDAPAMRVCMHDICTMRTQARPFDLYPPIDRPNRPIRPRGATHCSPLQTTPHDHRSSSASAPSRGGPKARASRSSPAPTRCRRPRRPTRSTSRSWGSRCDQKKNGLGCLHCVVVAGS